MGKINVGRVIISGIVAGIILDISGTVLHTVVIGKDWEAAMKALNRPPIGMKAFIGFMILGLVLGLLTMWLYAAIRPRYGAGPKTAVIAGLAVWAFAYFYQTAGSMQMHLFPARLLVIGLAWGLVEMIIASLAGGWFYKEEAG